MTNNMRLIEAALTAADLFRDGDTPDNHEIRELVRAADEYKADVMSHGGNHAYCLMCVVRQLTEGTPKFWTPNTPGQKVAGVVLAVGKTAVPRFQFEVPYVDLWQGGSNRIRVVGYGTKLANGIESARPLVGDILEATFNGMSILPPNPRAGRRNEMTYQDFTVTVKRGHH